MKKVEAVVREERLPVVLAALGELGYPGITITPVKGHGRQKGVKEMYRGVEITVDFLPKVKLNIIVADAAADSVVAAIAEHARTGSVGDGKIRCAGSGSPAETVCARGDRRRLAEG